MTLFALVIVNNWFEIVDGMVAVTTPRTPTDCTPTRKSLVHICCKLLLFESISIVCKLETAALTEIIRQL